MNEQVRGAIARMLAMTDPERGVHMMQGAAENLASQLRRELSLVRKAFCDIGHQSEIAQIEAQLNKLRQARSDKTAVLSSLHYCIYGLSMTAG
jgi:hypothetical protein